MNFHLISLTLELIFMHKNFHRLVTHDLEHVRFNKDCEYIAFFCFVGSRENTSLCDWNDHRNISAILNYIYNVWNV